MQILDRVVEAYKTESNNLSFIPKPRIERDIIKGRVFEDENGFVYIGSPRSEFTPIHAVYIYPEKRTGSPFLAMKLLSLLPKKGYRVRCVFGVGFWRRMGLKQVGKVSENTRSRDVFILEGEIDIPFFNEIQP